MPYYLSEYMGTGPRSDPFMPVGSDQPGWSAIDIRASGLNACLLHVPIAFSDPRARFLADDKLESLTNPQKNFLSNKLGVDLSSPTLLRDIIATIMTNPPANGWKPITPGFLRWEIHLGGELLWEAPRASGGATDNFNRANETPIAAPWAASHSDFPPMNLSSNAVVTSSGDSNGRYAAAASGSDQFSQCSVASFGSSSGGPIVRALSTAGSQYQYDNFGSPTLGEIAKFLNGVGNYTNLGTGTVTRANPLRIEAEGSTIRIYSNTVLSKTVTDATITGGQPGIFVYSNSFDDWSGGDLTPAGVVTAGFPPIIVGSESYQDRSRW